MPCTLRSKTNETDNLPFASDDLLFVASLVQIPPNRTQTQEPLPFRAY